MKRALPILIAALVLQIIIYALVSRDSYHVTVKENFLTVDTSQVNYIKIVNEKGELTLNRKGVRWQIGDPLNYPANPSYVKTLLEKVAGLKMESLITKNTDKYVLYELDNPIAKYVEIGIEGGEIQKFYCGKSNETYTHTYIRHADSDEVWLVEGSPRSSFSREPEQWRDKKILALDKTMIEKLELTFPDETIQLMRRINPPTRDSAGVTTDLDTVWTARPSKGKPFEPVDKAMNRILNTLKRLNAISFIDAGSEDMPDFSSPTFSVEISLEGNQTEYLEFIPKADEETRWFCRHNRDDKVVFVVYQSSVKNMQKRVADLKGEDTDKK
jgi:hypothetical protein